jgi:hypothetical protein
MPPRRSERAVLATLLAAALASVGCASASYRIPHDELMRLSQTAPEQRGQRVRVIQSLGGDEPP